MFNNSGLSLNQAPPIKVVLRFFLTGSFFGIVAGLYALFAPNIFEIASTHTIILTHILTLGVMASFMLGALFQMLPVLCGAAILTPIPTSLKIHYSLLIGVIFLIATFYTSSFNISLFAIFFLSAALLGAFYTLTKELLSITHNNSSFGMLLSLFSLFFLTLIGFALLLVRVGVGWDTDYLLVKEIHISFAIFGWVSLLIMAVAFQVIEMFYVTLAYPSWFAKYAPLLIFALLLIELIFKLTFLKYIIAAILALFAILTIVRLVKRKRKVNDATIWFWLLSMGSLLLFVLFLFIDIFFPLNYFYLGIFFSFFAISAIFAMSYKIVPFLVWFHLNAQGYFNAPMMHEVIHPKIVRLTFYIYSSSFIFFLFSFIWSPIIKIGAILYTLAFVVLFTNVYIAWKKYIATKKEGKKFEFGGEIKNIP
ncbi:MAG: hypothetical protein GXN91_00925, partial [Epsilonproteobacteria bacterium]|nr:hypothetical protein [Campylobacterota bacterium]